MFHLSKKRFTFDAPCGHPQSTLSEGPLASSFPMARFAGCEEPAPRRDAIHAFDLNIEDHLGTTEVATGISVTAAVELVDFVCVCVFFGNDLNLKPRDPRPKLKLAKTWKKTQLVSWFFAGRHATVLFWWGCDCGAVLEVMSCLLRSLCWEIDVGQLNQKKDGSGKCYFWPCFCWKSLNILWIPQEVVNIKGNLALCALPSPSLSQAE